MARISSDDSTKSDSRPSAHRARARLGLDRTRSQSRGVLRQLFRLSALLLVVFFLMKNARNPRHYEPFFGQKTSSQPLDSKATAEPKESQETSTASDGEPNPEASQKPNPALALVEKIPMARRGTWIARLADSDELARSTGAEASLPPDESESGFRLRLAEDEIASVFEGLAPDMQSQLIPNLLSALRADAMNRVVDGSVFRSSDADALYDLLERSSKIPSSVETALEIATVPLLQQPDVYRGQRIRVQGEILRVEKISTAPNPFSIEEYWKLWIRPRVGAFRPMVFVTSKVPTEIAALAGAPGEDNKNLSSGPSIDSQGIYLKRLAYRSGAGADVAPLLVGPLDAFDIEDAPSNLPSQETDFPLPLGSLLAIASVIGIVIAVLLMRQGNTNERRIRKMRSQMPIDTEYLNSIELNSTESEVEENPLFKEIKL
jgi:hypothetical protein